MSLISAEKVVTLEQVDQQWLLAVDDLPQLICLVANDGRVARVNRTLARWQLGDVDEVRGTDLHDVLHKNCDDPGCCLALCLQRTLGKWGTERHTKCCFWDTVLERHFEIRITLPVWGQGTSEGDRFAVVIMDDVTDLTSREEQSQRKAQLLNRRVDEVEGVSEMVRLRKREILDKAPLLASMTDPTGKPIYLNTVGRKMLGMDEQQELSGLTFIGFKGQRAGARLILSQEALAAAERDGVWSGDAEFASQDGIEAQYHLTLIAHRNEHGLLLGFTLLGSDTSAWVLIEEALLASQGALQSSESNLRRVTAEHLTIQEEERRRIALDLHDGLGQTLSLLKMSIQEMTRLVSEGIKSDTAKHIEHMKAMVTTAVDETRLLSMKLRPALIDDLGIVVTLGWYFRELKVDCPNITFECDIGVKESEVAEPLKIDIFRIVQEASNNSIKHATTDRIKVSLNRQAACIELLVEDFGSGFEVSAASKETGSGRRLGLHSMRERAESSGGKYTLRSRKGLGTSVSVCWPLSGEVGA